MTFLDYDYDDLARQVQDGLERIGVSFLRSHGARIRRDLVDFHGFEQIDLELSSGGHTLVVHQVGRPRGFDHSTVAVSAGAPDEEFDSTFDGSPAVNTPADEIARWLACLPAGEAPPERTRVRADAANPFAAERQEPTLCPEPEPLFNPFLGERSGSGGGLNPFADADRARKRDETLRRLRDEDG